MATTRKTPSRRKSARAGTAKRGSARQDSDLPRDDDERSDQAGENDDEVLVGELVPGPGVELDDDEPDPESGEAGESGEPGEPEQIDAELDRLVAGKRRSTSNDDEAHLKLLKRDPLTAYIQETKRYSLLSREEEHDLAVRYVEHGDTDAARRLIESNLRLVVKIAYEYRRAHRNLLDLVQEGNIGLMQAVKKYDPYRGVKLSSYAAWWIRAYILKFILNNWRMVKIGTTQAQRKLFFNLRKEKERLEQLGFAPTPALLAENLDVNEKDVVEMEKRLSAPDASLDAPVAADDEGGTRTRMDYLPSPRGERPDLQVVQNQFQTVLREKLETFNATLEGREATIFQERWLTDSPLTLQQIGDRYGVSRERARQLEKRLLGRLRKYLEQEFGAEVDIGALSTE